MTAVLAFAITVITISISGVMSPGPLFTTNIAYGIKGGWRTGIKIAFGHTLVELPLIILLGLGVISMSSFPRFKEDIAVLGAISLFIFVMIQVKSTFSKPRPEYAIRHGPLVAGILLSALNPFFLIWWFTVGFKLISDALALYSLIGIWVMFGFHIWMDYSWFATVGYLSSHGKKILSTRNYKIFTMATSGALVYFGINFLIYGLN